MKTLELSCSLWWSPCGTSRLPYTQADLLTSSEVLHNEHHCRGLLLALADIEHNASVTVASSARRRRTGLRMNPGRSRDHVEKPRLLIEIM